MKKFFKSVFSLILALTLVFQVAASASAKSGASKQSDPTNAAIVAIKAFINEYNDGISNLTVYLKEVGENLMEFYAEYDDDAGEHHVWKSNVFYDLEKQIIYGKDNAGALALGFDWDVDQMIFYTPTNAWQRGFGFSELYDFLSPAATYYYKTIRMKFSCNGKDWLIQFWKGRYSISTGAEIGIYNKPLDRKEEFYDCAADDCMMPMSMKLYKSNKLLFERPLQTHWWLTGFKGGFGFLCQLRLEGAIEFPSAQMKDAFTDAVDRKIFTAFKYTVQGNTVSFVW